MASSSRFSLLSPQLARSPSFSETAFSAFARLSSSPGPSVHPWAEELNTARFVSLPADDTIDPRRLSLDADTSALDAEIVFRPAAVINTACMLEDQLRDLERACAAAEERCEAKRRRVRELEEEGSEGRVDPVKRAIGLGFVDGADTSEGEGEGEDEGDSDGSDSTVHGHPSPTVSSLVHQEMRSSYLGEAARSRSFRDMLDGFTVQQKQDGVTTLQDEHPPSPSRKRSFTHSLRKKMAKSLGRARSTPKRVPLMESSALKALLKNSKGGSGGTWRRRKADKGEKEKENVQEGGWGEEFGAYLSGEKKGGGEGEGAVLSDYLKAWIVGGVSCSAKDTAVMGEVGNTQVWFHGACELVRMGTRIASALWVLADDCLFCLQNQCQNLSSSKVSAFERLYAITESAIKAAQLPGLGVRFVRGAGHISLTATNLLLSATVHPSSTPCRPLECADVLEAAWNGKPGRAAEIALILREEGWVQGVAAHGNTAFAEANYVSSRTHLSEFLAERIRRGEGKAYCPDSMKRQRRVNQFRIIERRVHWIAVDTDVTASGHDDDDICVHKLAVHQPTSLDRLPPPRYHREELHPALSGRRLCQEIPWPLNSYLARPANGNSPCSSSVSAALDPAGPLFSVSECADDPRVPNLQRSGRMLRREKKRLKKKTLGTEPLPVTLTNKELVPRSPLNPMEINTIPFGTGESTRALSTAPIREIGNHFLVDPVAERRRQREREAEAGWQGGEEGQASEASE
ncbi:hypothetical protein OE88DRAFT_1728576 [Heliocybe sulcata]|uniref:Uncharacterized protein n=1 Tax=Heliocybe sulcata TaxID=5364 RepID=A0A5C3MNY0_9AGAM|nr:hypothetical protein OE88DRAFT_1728576 [Heliocybe sulcata]